MKTVYKYPIPFEDEVSLLLPEGAEFVHVGLQGPNLDLFVWALVDTEKTEQTRTLRIAGTGHSITEDVEHIGSFLIQGGLLVFHVFEIKEDRPF